MATIETDLGTLIATIYEASSELPPRCRGGVAARAFYELLMTHRRRDLVSRLLMESVEFEAANDAAFDYSEPLLH